MQVPQLCSWCNEPQITNPGAYGPSGNILLGHPVYMYISYALLDC
jgi:hypothetical protein